ncbi:unnamed protein product, partial [Mesorhabditis spiculigera]
DPVSEDAKSVDQNHLRRDRIHKKIHEVLKKYGDRPVPPAHAELCPDDVSHRYYLYTGPHHDNHHNDHHDNHHNDHHDNHHGGPFHG